MFAHSTSSKWFLANTDWQYPISEDGEIKYFKTTRHTGKNSFLKMFFPPPRPRSCVYSTDARQERSNSGITHCGNKYQKKIKKMWKKIFFSGQDLNVGLVACYFCSLFFFPSDGAHSTNGFR